MIPGRLASRVRTLVLLRRGDVVGVAVIVALAFLFFSPALKDGMSLGGFDFDTARDTGLGQSLVASVFHSVTHSHNNGDAVSQLASWNVLNWRLVHNGQFPLWNADSALGVPQFLNFESAPLSLPNIISYAFPVSWAFLVAVLVKVILAGTGAYAFVRVLGLSPIGATFSGVTFMLSGAFVNWVTWSLSDVVAMTGWICLFAVLAYRHRRRFRHVVGLAVAVAFAVYGGFPEIGILGTVAFAVLLVATAAIAFAFGRRPSLRGLAAAGAGFVGGACLSAPLWFPGLQVVSLSHRELDGAYPGLPFKTMGLLIAEGYEGLPYGPQASFQLRLWNYYESVDYVGLVALVLALVGLYVYRRRPIVLGLAVATLVCLAIVYESPSFHPLQTLLDHSGQLSRVRDERLRVIVDFFVAVLGGFGLEALWRRSGERSVRFALSIVSALGAAVVAYLVVDSATADYRKMAIAVQSKGQSVAQLTNEFADQRFDSLVWPVGLVGLLAVVCLWLFRRASRASRSAHDADERPLALVATLLVAQAAFLFFAGVGVPSYSHAFFPTNAPERQLQSIVGQKLLALDGGNNKVSQFTHIGFYPDVNLGYGVRLFAVHDPLVPVAYFRSWPYPSQRGAQGVGLFVPAVDSVVLARRYGISYILSAPGVTPPRGAVKVADLAGETLSRVPGASQFSFLTAGDRVESVTTNGDGAFALQVRAPKTSVLVARITALPGWNVAANGRALAPRTYDGVMEEVTVPAGTSTVTLSYFPRRLRLGIELAIAAAVLLVLGGLASTFLERRRRATSEAGRRSDAPGSA